MIYDVFSKRDRPLPDVFQCHSLPPKFRNQVFKIWKDTALSIQQRDEQGYWKHPLMLKVYDLVGREHGLDWFSDRDSDIVDTLTTTLLRSNDTELTIDIIEASIRLLFIYGQVGLPKLTSQHIFDAITELNHRFVENGIGYEFNIGAKKLIPFSNIVTHQTIVRPALELLAGKEYESANKEYLAAWDDYKQGDYRDCIHKCGCAFESALKTICANRGWTPTNPAGKPTDKLASYVQELVAKTGLETSYETPLINIGTMRNSVAHGKPGPPPPQPPDYKARYALNATASAVLFVHNAAQAAKP